MMMWQMYWGDLPWICIEGIFCRRLDYWPNRVKSDKGGYPAAVRTLSVPAEKRGRGLTWIAHCQSGSHVHALLLSKLGGKIVVVGIIHLGLRAFLKLQISCTFPSIFLSLWDICCTFGIYCRDFVFLPRNCRSGIWDVEKIGRGVWELLEPRQEAGWYFIWRAPNVDHHLENDTIDLIDRCWENGDACLVF